MTPSPRSQQSPLPTTFGRTGFLWNRLPSFHSEERNKDNSKWYVRSSTLVIILTGILATLPVALLGLSLQSHDGFCHVHWYAGFSRQLLEGNPYPRWMEQTNGGLGSPVFFFYPPLPYYAASCFAFLAPLDPSGVHRLGLLTMCAMIASGLTARTWLRRFLGEREAVLRSLIYMLLPFHLAIDLWARGALGQFCAYVWLPLILTAVHSVVNRNSVAPLGLAIAYTALILTNIPTLLIFSPIPILYAFTIAPKRERVRSALIVLAAMIVGAGTAGGYLYPALTHRKYVNVAAVLEGVFDYHNNFLFTAERLLSLNYNSQVAWMVLLFAVALLSGWIAARQHEQGRGKSGRAIPVTFWRFTALAGLFMMTPLSTPLWDLIPPLRLVQFPMRFTVIYTLSLAASLPVMVCRQPGPTEQTTAGRAAKRMLTLAAILSLPFSLKFGLAHYGQAWQHQRQASTRKELKNAIDAPEYRTIWSTAIVSGGFDTLKALVERVQRENHPVSIEEGKGRIPAVERTGNGITLRTEGSTDLTIQFPTFYYPGWVAEVDSGRATTRPSVGYGLLQVCVPRGTRTVRVGFAVTEQEKRGYFVSLCSLGIVCLWGLVALCVKRRRRKRDDEKGR